MLRAGILMPRSTLYPTLGLDILNGLKQSLKQQGIFDEVKLFIDNIGFGIEEPEIYGKAEKMILQEDADIVFVCADTRIAEMLQPLFTASNKILIMLHFGANLPDSWQPAPTTITHSLNFCFHAGLTGKLAAQEAGKEAVNAVSYYDGGYHQCFCMISNHQLHGGIPAYNHITHLKITEFTLDPMIAFLEENIGVHTILCLFAGEQAEHFYRAIAPVQKRSDLNLYVTPMMLEGSLKEVLGSDFSIDKVKGYIPWHAALDNEHNTSFKEYYTQATGQPVNYFSLLGWDAGLIVKEIHARPGINAAAIVKSLAEVSFNSPRGWMKIDPATNYSYGPSYLASCKNNMEISTGPEKDDMENEWNTFTKQALQKGESSSWRNTYLCI